MKHFFTIFSILISVSVFAQPANDDCPNAISLTLQDINSVNYTSGNLGDATESTPACSGSVSTDVWYSFTATTEANKIYLPPQTGLDLAFEIYDACGGNSIVCIDNNSTSISENYYDYHYTIGQTYYIKVFLYNQSFSDAPFDIAVINMSQPNDECTTSIDIPVQGDDNPVFVQSNLGGATESLTACTGSYATDVWFSFTATSTNANIIIDAQSNFNPVLEVFDACGGNSIACVNNNGTNFSESYYNTNYIQGNQYFIRVFGYNQFFEDKDFNITVIDSSLVTSINDYSDYDGLNIYPNPASDKLTIKMKDELFNNIQILSVTGLVLLEQSIENANIISVSELKQGIYFIKLYSNKNNKQLIKRLIIE
jgi:hypothetical protein